MSDIVQHEMAPLFGRKEVARPEERILNPDELVQIDLSVPLADSHEMHDKIGVRGNLVATVNAGTKSFMIIDGRDTRSNRDFLIADETFSMEQKVGFKGVIEGKPIVIGRENYTNRFNYPNTVSRDHFSVTYENGELFIRNMRPTNNTAVTAHLAVSREPKREVMRHIVEDRRTRAVEDRIQQHPNYGEKDDTAPYGYYLNHPILGRASTSVEDGVYMGGSAREAILVDGKSVAMRRVYEGVESELRRSFTRDETLHIGIILSKVMTSVQDVMPYDGPKTANISGQHYGDKLVGLSTYLEERAGVCRHQALMAAYILENLINDGHMAGVVGVERNTVEDLGGTHAWAVYKSRHNGKDEIIVVDPAQSFVGTKDQALRDGRWEYRLASDDY